MFFIPGPVIAALTFPGVIVHEMAHQLFCRLFRVAVLDVCYFRFGNPAGYVIPSTGDAKTLRTAVSGPSVSILAKLVAYPIVGIIYVGAFGSMVWLDAIYGLGVALATPKLLVMLFA